MGATKEEPGEKTAQGVFVGEGWGKRCLFETGDYRGGVLYNNYIYNVYKDGKYRLEGGA